MDSSFLEIFFSSYFFSVFKIEIFTWNKIHSFSVYTYVSLDKCMYLYNYHHNYDVEYFIFPKSSLI